MKIKWIINLLFILIVGLSLLHSTILEKDLKYVMPSATRFSAGKVPLPHFKAYDEKKLIGICYLSIDITPEIYGYNGPINILIGLNKNGSLSGIKVMQHKENNVQAQVIVNPSFEEQFKCKNITDGFILSEDINEITGATITIKCVSEIIKRSSMKMYQYCFKEEEKTIDKEKISMIIEQEGKVSLRKMNINQYILSGVIFFILVFTALNCRLYFILKKKKNIIIPLTIIEIGVIIFYISFIKITFREYCNHKNAYSPVYQSEISPVSKGIQKKDDLSSSMEEEIILKPKGRIQRVNKDLIKEQIKTGNLSGKEADNYKKVE